MSELALILLIVAAVFIFMLLLLILSRYRKCPSDKVLVIMVKSDQIPTEVRGQLDVYTAVPHLYGRYFNHSIILT